MKTTLLHSTMVVFVAGLLAIPVFGAQPKNFFANPSFELGRDSWQMDKAGKTECQFALDDKDAADGRYSALLTLGAVEEWGVQFGQNMPAGEQGKTYTFAVFARSVSEPVEVALQIERHAQPYDRAAALEKIKLTSAWQEIHVTFTVKKDFHQGWFAYISCTQPRAQFKADMFRLYEGDYVPHKQMVREELATVGVRILDTGKLQAKSLPGEVLKAKTGWVEVPEDNLTHPFKGDVVFMNDRIALVLRKGANGAELYSLGNDLPVMRSRLAPLAGTQGAALASYKITENNPGVASVEAAFTATDGKALTVRYELRVGQPVVLTEARSGATGLRMEAPCRFAVMPDFFADDIVVDATDALVAPASSPVSPSVVQAELPSDNFFLHLLPGGDAIVMTVLKTSEEDIRINLAGEGEQRMIGASELRYGKDAKIWVAVLAAPGIWHHQNISREDTNKIIRLDWKAPFPAQWRTDWRRVENLTDSWEMLTEKRDGGFMRYGPYGGPETFPVDRKRWTTVLGSFKYPCWVDKEGQGYLQPLRSEALRFQGPAIIYPINRTPATALDTFTIVDIVRNTLGVGPCEYVLDVEGQRSQYQGRATCSVRDTLNPIYAKQQQKQRRADIERTLVELMTFVRHIRGRIENYVSFGHEMLTYLAAQKQAHPDLSGRLEELENIARLIDTKVAARRDHIKTPDHVAAMITDFRQTVLDYEGDDALAKCKKFTEAWVDVGGNQDELVGEGRWVIKMLRQRAGLLMATDPRMAEIAREIRQRSQVVLRNPAGHEGARH
ncbi:MAG: carbohydrate binding domain-containing protein [Verrucomicrobiota bacterium]